MTKWILSKQDVMDAPQNNRVELGRFDSEEEANRVMTRIVRTRLFPSGELYWRICGDASWKCYDFGSWSTFFVVERRDVSEN